MREPPEPAATPARMPLACGAIGRFDRPRVAAIASTLPGAMSVVVDRDGGILMTDRPPRRWSEGSTDGFCWGRALLPDGRPKSWRDAGLQGDAGLVIEPTGAAIHSAVNGAISLYWLEHEGAIYFSSLIDPLAMSAPCTLGVDWSTWMTLLVIGTPGGPHTPFEEINRLPPQAAVTMDGDRASERVDEWPWALIEPSLSVERGAPDVLEAIRELVARLPDKPIPHCLSGGIDSRLIATVMAERGLDVTAYTVNADSGNDREEQAAAAVAKALGFKHRIIRGRAEDYWPETEARALHADFLRNANPWLAPAHAAVAAAAQGVVLEGFGGEQMLDSATSYFRASMVGSDDGDLAGELWRAMRKERAEPLLGEFGEFAVKATRRRYRKVAEQFRGHPNRAALTVYWLRAMNGISHVAFGGLGSQAIVETPFVSNEVAVTALAVDPAEKLHHSLRRAVIALSNPTVAQLPDNHQRFPATSGLPIRRKSEEVLAGFREALADGPLAPWVTPAMWAAASGKPATNGVQPRRVFRATQGVVSYHLWVRRYGSRVRGTDPAEALGIARP